jgi:hypothetical protein
MSRPLQDYPTSIGNVMLSVFPHVGPASYTQVTIVPGTVPVTGGDTIQSAEAGMRYFDDIIGEGLTDDGAFDVQVVSVTVTNPAGTGSSILGGIPSKTFIARWIALKTATYGGQAQTAGSEAVAGTNLSTFCVRLTAVGCK